MRSCPILSLAWSALLLASACGPALQEDAHPSEAELSFMGISWGEDEVKQDCPAPDPHVLTHRFTRGPRRGECVNTSVYRAAMILEEQQARVYGLPSGAGRWTVANLKGIDGFYVASIPTAAVRQVILQLRPFSTVNTPLMRWHKSVHTQARIRFSEPVFLTQQTPGGTIQSTEDLVLSNQGVGINEDFNVLLEGTNGSMVNVGVVFTAESKIQKQLIELESQVFQYPITFDTREGTSFVQAYIRTSFINGSAKTYNAFNANSNIALLQVFDQVRPPVNPTYQNFNNKQDALRLYGDRGLIKDTSQLPTWDADPTIQDQLKRLREQRGE